ncbi:MAG: hypothetical protein ACO3HF_00685 [Burkholderiaceae bacterium]
MRASLTHPVFSYLGQACLDRLQFMRPPAGPRLWLGPLPAGLSETQGAGWVHGEPLEGRMPRPPKPGYSVVIDTGSWPSNSLGKDWFSKINHMLNDGGVYLFASLGPSSLGNLRRTLERTGQSSAGLLPEGLTEAWTDMHDLGDQLQQAGLVSPVMESDALCFSYQTSRQFLGDLRAWPGRKNRQATDRTKQGSGLGLQALRASFTALSEQSGGLVLDWEMVVGHAWKPASTQKPGQKPKGSGFSPLKFFRKKP